MSDLNAVPAEVAPSTAPVVEPTPVAVAPAPAAPVDSADKDFLIHKSIDALPKEHMSMLHDILAHIHEGFTEFSLMTGLSRLTALFGHAKTKL